MLYEGGVAREARGTRKLADVDSRMGRESVGVETLPVR